MYYNILQYFEDTVKNFKNKIAIIENNKNITFSNLKGISLKIAEKIINNFDLNFKNEPIIVFLPKSYEAIASFIGILYSGNFYVPIDENSPIKRNALIIKNLKCKCIITKKKYKKALKQIKFKGKIIFLDEAHKVKKNNKFNYYKILRNKIDVDPIYAIATSGSTGDPKIVLISHRSVIDYIEWGKKCFQISEKEIIGSQSPFYFDNSTLDIYLTLMCGAKFVIIPKEKFTYPSELVDYINLKKINFIFWVPSVLANIAILDVLKNKKLYFLKKILFAGEVMAVKHLNYWINRFPKIMFANLYGPTEITVDCTYYKLKRKFKDHEKLPIGFPCRNSDILILNKKNKKCKINEQGELAVRGSSLALGYYNDLKKTNESFVQNPLNKSFPEKIYLTGDIVFINKRREIIFVGRKDHQIKHLGNRIELGEIENAAFKLDKIKSACVLYNQKKKIIVLFYIGDVAEEKIIAKISKQIPKYMVPKKYIKLKKFPLNANSKIDKKKLEKLF